MKFLFDENLSPAHARRLRSRGHDAVSVVELGLSGASDSEVRRVAIQDGRILVTLDGDFGNILRFPAAPTPGVVWFRLHPPTECGIETAINRFLERIGDADLAGKLIVVDEDKIRVRG